VATTGTPIQDVGMDKETLPGAHQGSHRVWVPQPDNVGHETHTLVQGWRLTDPVSQQSSQWCQSL